MRKQIQEIKQSIGAFNLLRSTPVRLPPSSKPDDLTDFGPPHHHVFNPPLSIVANPVHAMRTGSGKSTTCQRTYCIIKDATYIGGKRYIVSKDGTRDYTALNYTIGTPGMITESFFNQLRSHSKTTIEKPTFLLTASYHENYYHWLVDNLTKLAAVRHILDSGEEFTVLIPSENSLRPFHRDTLRLAAKFFPQAELRSIKEDHPYLLRQLVSVTFGAHQPLPHPEDINFLNQLTEAAQPFKKEQSRQRVLITRPTASRAIANKGALEQLLSLYRFKTVDPSKLSFNQQTQLFSQAEFVLGTHGAALTNIAFCRSATVLELFSNWYNTCFYELSESRGLHYAYQPRESSDSPRPRKNDPVYADLEGIRRFLEERFG